MGNRRMVARGLTPENPVKARQVRASGETVALTYPITIGTSDPIRSLTFRRPSLGDLRGMSLDEADLTADEMIDLIERLSGLSRDQVEAVDFADLDAIGETLGGFFGKSPNDSED